MALASSWLCVVISEASLAGRGPRPSTLELLRRRVGPTGELGLTLSQRVAVLLGGSLWAFGGGAGGARFALWLPAEHDVSAERAAAETEASDAARI